MRRSLLPALALTLLAVLLMPTAPAAARTSGIDWKPCDQDATAECGTLTVPIDWATPGSGTIDLALARRKATDATKRIGSLVVNPGGPGVSGVDFALFSDRFLSAELTKSFDIVGFDPRGVGRSHPVVCSSALLRAMPPTLMRSQADFEARIAYNKRLREDCEARTGPLFDHVSTVSVVRDLEAIRAALDEERVTFYGVSYGTLIGQQYAERYPGRVRALVLDSNFDHSLGTGAYLDTAAINAESAFDEFADWCAKNATCPLHGKDVRAFWAKLLARADRGELHQPGQPDVPLTSWDLIDQAFGAFYGPYWTELAESLLATDTAAATKTPSGEASRAEELSPFPRAVFCQDFSFPVRDYREYAARLDRQRALAPDMRYNPAALYAIAACLDWPTPIPNPQHRLNVDGTPPILVANSLYDPATSYLWAAGVAGQIGREAALLTYEGWGHGVYGRSDCVTGAMDRYLISLTVPTAAGSRCPAIPPPAVGLNRSPSGVQQFLVE
ncbi:alpha/beta hydrolase [Nonomuraea sp. NPDC052129]|uniref:alpha/beta hydrolase n=1 Tax=Nonomuraea sp. NPDC052129 TaxID=3154651 RepID=UPI00342DC468